MSEIAPDCPILPIGLVAGAEFGTSVALTADLLVVGAPAPDTSDSGRVHVFARSEGGYVEQVQASPIAVPFADASAPADADFGASVDADADTIVAGAPFDVVGDSAGSASVFVRSEGVWTLQAKLIDESGECGAFGTDVAVSGNTIVVGAPGGDCALVFERSGADWSLAETLAGSVGGARFGTSVGISGDTMVVGAPGAASGSGCSTAGSVAAFRRGVSGWSLEDTIDEPSGGECFGAAVALDAGVAVIGAPFDDAAAVDGGAAYVATRSGSAWETTAQLLSSPPPSAGDRFGSSVDIFGDSIVVGTPGVAAWLFELGDSEVNNTRGAEVWSQIRRYDPPASLPAANSNFGASVALASGVVAVGAPGESPNGFNDAGAVYPGDAAEVPIELCGDGDTTASEECDDGDTLWNPGQACNADCERLACGDSNDSGNLTASDALFALRTAVATATCDLEVCDVTGNGTIAASDALLILKKAVGGEGELICP